MRKVIATAFSMIVAPRSGMVTVPELPVGRSTRERVRSSWIAEIVPLCRFGGSSTVARRSDGVRPLGTGMVTDWVAC